MELIIIDPAQLALLVGLTVGLVEVAKRVGLPAQYAPVVSIACGLGLAALVLPLGSALALSGIVVGLTASGLYSGTRATLQA